MDKVIQKMKELGVGRVVALFLAGVALLALTFFEREEGAEQPPLQSTEVRHEEPESDTPEYYEQRLREVLEQTEGVGKVEVMLAPDLSGVLVVAEGAGNGNVVLEITNAAYVLFAIPAHKVRVLQYH